MNAKTQTLLVLSLAAALAACGGPDQAQPAALDTTSASSDALTADAVRARRVMPELVRFRDWNPDRAFVPSFEVSSHFVNQIAQSPDDPKHFRAYGSDSRTGVIFFQIDGSYAEDFEPFLTIVARQVAGQGRAAAGLHLSYGYGVAGEVHGPIPTGPGPQGVPELVARVLSFARQVQAAIARSVQTEAR